MRLTRFLLANNKFLVDAIEKYSRYHPSVLSVQKLLDFGTKRLCVKNSYLFLRKELAVRLANIMKEIGHLPPKLLEMQSVRLVDSWYRQSFEELIGFENRNADDPAVPAAFTDTLVMIRNRHNDVVPTMAEGVLELKERHGHDENMEHSIQYFLDRFYMSRISIRVLINQHILLFAPGQPQHPRHIGSIDPRCDIVKVVWDAYENARFLCDQYYMTSPKMELKAHNSVESQAPIELCYIPSNLYHMLFELLKNAMRAVVEHYGAESDNPLPPIQVLVAQGKEDVTIRLSDLGGGIAQSQIDRVFMYMVSTAPLPPRGPGNSAPLAGYGYGLPLSRLYARYLHGDLVLNSVEGYGTDAMIYLKAISSDAMELLPVYNKTSSAYYKSSIQVSDWSHPVDNGSSRLPGYRNGLPSARSVPQARPTPSS